VPLTHHVIKFLGVSLCTCACPVCVCVCVCVCVREREREREREKITCIFYKPERVSTQGGASLLGPATER
jgi:hypothetical protein